MNFNIYNFLSIMGVAQGLIFSILLVFVNKGRKTSNYLLAGLVACIAVTMGRHILRDMHVLKQVPILQTVPLTFLLMIGPLLYLYTKSVCTSNYKFNFRAFRHLLPAVFYFTIRILHLFDQLFFNTNTLSFLDGYGKIEVIIGVLSMSIYAIITFKSINEDAEISDSDVQNRIWMKKILVGWGIGWLMFATLTFVDMVFFDYKRPYSDYYILFLYLAFVIYWLGLKGFYEMIMHSHIEVQTREASIEIQEEVIANESLLSDKSAILKNEMHFMTKLMEEEKPYLDPELSLEKLSEKLGFSTKKVSSILNQGFKKSFYQYINTYRVEEFKERLAKPENQNLTLLAIAFDSGFNSKSTFNYIFKKETGLTPLQLKKKLLLQTV